MELSPMRRASAACLLATCLLASGSVGACINAFGTDKSGNRFEAQGYTGEDLEKMLTYPREKSYYALEPARFEKLVREKPTFESRTNLGVSWIYQARYPEAIRYFVQLEKAYPGRPETAANLGTALELAGYDAVALKWIKLGIRRNRDEHHGTEWLHGRILEAKIADRRGSWDRKESIAGVEFDPAVIPAVPQKLPLGNDRRPVKPHELDRAFRYQLNERMKFVRPKDWVVANLLQDWATLNLAGGPVENARVQYRLAIRYGLRPTSLIRERLSRIDGIIDASHGKVPRGFDCAICEPPPPPPAQASA